MESAKQIGERISRFRSQKKMSRYRLAVKSEISFSYIKSLEEGIHNPSLRILEKVANGLDVPVSSLIGE